MNLITIQAKLLELPFYRKLKDETLICMLKVKPYTITSFKNFKYSNLPDFFNIELNTDDILICLKKLNIGDFLQITGKQTDANTIVNASVKKLAEQACF